MKSTYLMAGFVAMGLLQSVATFFGLVHVLDGSWVLALILTVVFGWMLKIPLYGTLIGTVLGVLGAHYGWGWGWFASILLFAWWPIVVFASALIASRAKPGA